MTEHPIDKKRAIKLQVKRYVLGNFLGMYRSVFRGKGVDYDEIRKYVPGDDPKSLVWAKFAQLGEPYVKTYLEERDLSVIVAVDTSGSVFWARPEKAKIALEAAATLIFSAAISRDRVGLALFSDDLEEFVPPRRGVPQAGKLVEKLAGIGVGVRRTFLAKSLRSIGARRGPKRSVMVIISDFISDDDGWQNVLASLAEHNDVIALKVVDRWEGDPPTLGWVYAKDSETGENHLVNCDRAFHSQMQEQLIQQRNELNRVATQHNIGSVELAEGQDAVKVLRAFFDRRRRLLRRGSA